MHTNPFITQFVIATALNFLIGLALLVFGRKLPRNGDWLLWLGLAAYLVVTISGLAILREVHNEPLSWIRGWIGRGVDPRRIHVGILLDIPAVTVLLLCLVLAFSTLFTRGLIKSPMRPERVYSGIAFGTTGVALAWLSLTVWLSLVGILICVLAAFIVLTGQDRPSDHEADFSIRFGIESVIGFLLSTLGASFLVMGGTQLRWDQAIFWLPNEPVWSGVFLLVAGLMIQVRPFPVLGWLLRSTETPFPIRILLGHIFVGWAAFSILLRLEGTFHSIGVMRGLGLSAFVLCAVTLLSGLFQTDWKKSLTLWIASNFFLVFGALSFAGPRTAIPILICGALCAFALSLLGQSSDPVKNETPKGNRVATTILLVLSVFGCIGLLGFASAGSFLRLVQGLTKDFGISFLCAFIIFISAVLMWKVFWMLRYAFHRRGASWETISISGVLVLLSLGVFWNGTLTGGAFFGEVDRVLNPILKYFFISNLRLDEDIYQKLSHFHQASWLYWGALGVAFVTALWLRKGWSRLAALDRSRGHGVADFFESGYYVDEIGKRMVQRVARFGGNLQRWIDPVTDHALPRLLSHGLASLSRGFSGFSQHAIRFLDQGVSKTIQVPGKAFQVIQSGDLQWYLSLVIGAGLAILMHFLLRSA